VTRQHSLVDSHFGDSNVGHIGDGGSSLLQYEHENEKLVVMLAKHIADKENKEEFKESVNDWDEVLRAFGDAVEESSNSGVVAASADSVIPNLLLRLKAEKSSGSREKYISKVLTENKDLCCTCEQVVELLHALRYDHEKLIIFQRFIPIVTDPQHRHSVSRSPSHLSHRPNQRHTATANLRPMSHSPSHTHHCRSWN
jgi:hypothetical protein